MTPPAPPRLLMDYLRDHLVAQGLVRRAKDDTAPDMTLPPMWLSPDEIPAPGEEPLPGQNVVIAATWAPETPSARMEGFLSLDHVDLWIRTRSVPQAVQAHHQLRAELHDRPGWDMAGLRVQESMLYQGLARTGGQAQALTHKCQYRFLYFAADADA
jgi:hypothetical protein